MTTVCQQMQVFVCITNVIVYPAIHFCGAGNAQDEELSQIFEYLNLKSFP